MEWGYRRDSSPYTCKLLVDFEEKYDGRVICRGMTSELGITNYSHTVVDA